MVEYNLVTCPMKVGNLQIDYLEVIYWVLSPATKTYQDIGKIPRILMYIRENKNVEYSE